jgi:hypothetical protein
MEKVKKFSGRAFFPSALLAVLIALGASVTSVYAGDPPACDGEPCDMQWECGTKCICNPHALKCFDNTEVE